MNEKNIELAKKASYSYREIKEEIEKDILDFIKERIESNEDNIKKLIKVTGENIDLDKVREFFGKEMAYKTSKKVAVDINGFIKGTLITPKGAILREESEVEKVIECYIDSILSRNAIIIADIEYSEISVKNLVLEIIKSALKKFNIDENLIQLLPYEEVDDSMFNRYIETKEKYIYLENETFIAEVENKDDLIRGEIDEVIEKINKNGICECAVIYTKNKEKGYKFMNLVNGKNVFINAGYSNIEESNIDELYIYKNIIYPTK